jgi:hypothetical protein
VIIDSIVNSGVIVKRIFNHMKCIIPTRVNVIIDYLCSIATAIPFLLALRRSIDPKDN